jgi:hypothetical protein
MLMLFQTSVGRTSKASTSNLPTSAFRGVRRTSAGRISVGRTSKASVWAVGAGYGCRGLRLTLGVRIAAHGKTPAELIRAEEGTWRRRKARLRRAALSCSEH